MSEFLIKNVITRQRGKSRAKYIGRFFFEDVTGRIYEEESMDVVHLHFQKAFEEPHGVKMKVHSLEGNVPA